MVFMIPGEIIVAREPGELPINVVALKQNSARRQYRRCHQIGSHFHFYEGQCGVAFRSGARSFRLNIAAGTAVRFEPGDTKEVEVVALAGTREVYGLNNKLDGKL